jgi:hypothetical protein
VAKAGGGAQQLSAPSPNRRSATTETAPVRIVGAGSARCVDVRTLGGNRGRWESVASGLVVLFGDDAVEGCRWWLERCGSC